MSNPRTEIPHDVLALFSAMGKSVPANLEPLVKLLTDDEKYLEDSINGGLRKTASTSNEGDGGLISSTYPTFVSLGNNVAVSYEKMHQSSRYEVDVQVFGQMGFGGGALHVGVQSAKAATDYRIGYATLPAGYVGPVCCHGAIPASIAVNFDFLTVRLAVSAGATWTQLAGCTNSIRVTESLW